MKLISTRDALDFLEHSAPRAWVKRMLAWMCITDELRLYATLGNVVGVASVMTALAQEEGFDPGWGIPDRDSFIAQRFNKEFAQRMLGKRFDEEVVDEPHTWSAADDPVQISTGTLLLADEINWDSGTITGLYFNGSIRDNSDFFWDSESIYVSSFSNADYRVALEGLSLELDRIEMLLPLGRIASEPLKTPRARNRLGRPPKWDWEGAMAAMAGEAQHPDGLPIGPGAQAELERRIASWFVRHTGDSSAPSQIRTRASRLMQILEMPESLKGA